MIRVHSAPIIFRSACTGGAQPLVARARAPVCPSLATPLLQCTTCKGMSDSILSWAIYSPYRLQFTITAISCQIFSTLDLLHYLLTIYNLIFISQHVQFVYICKLHARSGQVYIIQIPFHRPYTSIILNAYRTVRIEYKANKQHCRQ